jgi:hypothetical protein
MTTPGTGGLPEQRPDQGRSFAPPGTQPGSQNGVIRARLVIVSGPGAGVFVYSPSAGAGNLVASMAGAAGTDSYGNAYVAGVTAYPTVSGQKYAVELGNLSGPYAALAALTFASMTSPPAAPAAIAALSNGTDSGVTIESGAGLGAAASSLSVLDSVAGGQPGGLISLAAGLGIMNGPFHVTGALVGNTVNGVPLAQTSTPVMGTSGFGGGVWTAAQQSALLTLQSVVNGIISAGSATGIWP